MKILLINPPWVIHGKKNVWRSVASIMPPLGIAWLAAVLEREGHRVRILDSHAERMGIDTIAQWVRSEGPFNMVGITATTPLISNALRIARLIKAETPETRIVLGGVHPTVLPHEVLQDTAVDLVVRGEGECAIQELAAETPPEQVAGVSFRFDGSIVDNLDAELISDLDSLPAPAYHLLPMQRYRPAAGAARRLPAGSILATRGCPGRCTFCYRIFGHKFRYRSGRKVAEEVALLQERYGLKEVCFYDDTFTAVRSEVRNFCKAIEDLKLDLTWSCFSRIDTFNEETFRLMKNSGCHQVMFGVETSSPEIGANIRKKIDPERVRWVVHSTKRLGMKVRAAFMLGNPGETEQTILDTIRFAVELDPDLVQFNVTTPFPGTEMFFWAFNNGLLRTTNWEDYDLSTPVMELPTVSSEAVWKYYRIAHRRFYLRPRFVLNYVRRVRSFQDLIAAVRGLGMLVRP